MNNPLKTNYLSSDPNFMQIFDKKISKNNPIIDQNFDKINQILKDEDFQKELQDIVKTCNIDSETVINKAEKSLKDMYSTHDKFINEIFVNIFKTLIDMGFESKIDINYDELKNLTKLMSKHPVAFITSHKSYLDLIIFCIVLKKSELPLPFIFSGNNLDLPIIGDIVRKSGIIFIKRSIKDDIIYKTTLKHFIKWLGKRKNSHFAWAIEGTRSRTGKLSEPKVGILKYLCIDNIKYVPVSIIYDLIPDLDGIISENLGNQKKLENLTITFDYFNKIISENRGKIAIRFGNEINQTDKSNLIDFSYKLIHEINNITPVTVISLICNILLNKIGINEVCITNIISYIMTIIKRKNGLSLNDNMTISKSVNRAIELLLLEDTIKKQENRYIINNYKYFQAAYYVNMSTHYLYPRAFTELALFKIKDNENNDKNKEKIFWDEILFMKKIFKFEFFYKDNFNSEIELELLNMVVDCDNVQSIFKLDINKILQDQKILICPAIINNFLDSYKITLETLKTISNENIQENMFIEKCLFFSQELYWSRKMPRMEHINKSFLYNAIKLIKHLNLWNNKESINEINVLLQDINNISENIDKMMSINYKYNESLYKPLVEIDTNPLTLEILSSEKGSKIGAFFDLDKTLIKGYSIWSFAKNKLISKKIDPKEILDQILTLTTYLQNKEKFPEMITKIADTVKGISEKDFINLGTDIYLNEINIYSEAYELIEAHRSMGHTICIISAASQYQVEPIAKKLHIDNIECTRFEVENDKFTGKIIQMCWGEGKAEAGRKLALKYDLDLNSSYFYTDSSEDMALLNIVGKPRPINPDLELIKLSSEQNWSIQKFQDVDFQTRFENIMRTGLAFGSIIPSVISGYNTNGIEGALQTMCELISTVGGIIMDVKGEENIWKSRPCVFILNHQSYADMFIAVRLIKKNAVAVAKKEVKDIPVFGQLLESAGTIFIDTNNRDKAISSLQPAVEGLKNGTSIVIFPEGTRSFDRTLAEFKKGAFHMAMQGSVPIVPIVIKNSCDIIPRGTTVINPGIVNIVVLEAIPTTDWTIENMNIKIEEIRQLYINILNQ